MKTRFENEAKRMVWARIHDAIPLIVGAITRAGIHVAGQPGVPLEVGVIPSRVDRQAQVAAVMGQIRGLWTRALSSAGDDLEHKLRQFAELEFIVLPKTVRNIMHKAATGAALQEFFLVEAEGEPAPDPFFDPESVVLFKSLPAGQAAQFLASPVGGAAFRRSFGNLASQTLAQLENALLGGLLRGEGVPKVARAVRGILGNARWQAERIVRSEYVRVAGQAALMQFHANRDHLSGVRWVATLDQRTCLQCGKLDGMVWADATKAPVPVVNTHPNCRCIITPVIKNAKDLFLPPGSRAAFNGQVPDTETYLTWFPKQAPAFQRSVLGPTRYALWKAGKLQLRDFATASGVLPVADALAKAKGA